MAKKLHTVDEVVSALGGRIAVAKLFNRGATAIDHWLTSGVIPCNAYPEVLDALASVNKTVGVELFQWGRAAQRRSNRRNAA